MGKIKIIVQNSTGAVKKPGELDLTTGIIKFNQNNEYAHISGLGAGQSVFEIIEPVTKNTEAVSPFRSHSKKFTK